MISTCREWNPVFPPHGHEQVRSTLCNATLLINLKKIKSINQNTPTYTFSTTVYLWDETMKFAVTFICIEPFIVVSIIFINKRCTNSNCWGN